MAWNQEWWGGFWDDWQKDLERQRKEREKEEAKRSKDLFEQQLQKQLQARGLADPTDEESASPYGTTASKPNVFSDPRTNPLLSPEQKLEAIRRKYRESGASPVTDPNGQRVVPHSPDFYQDPGGGLRTDQVTDEALNEFYDPQTALGKASKIVQSGLVRYPLAAVGKLPGVVDDLLGTSFQEGADRVGKGVFGEKFSDLSKDFDTYQPDITGVRGASVDIIDPLKRGDYSEALKGIGWTGLQAVSDMIVPLLLGGAAAKAVASALPAAGNAAALLARAGGLGKAAPKAGLKEVLKLQALAKTPVAASYLTTTGMMVAPQSLDIYSDARDMGLGKSDALANAAAFTGASMLLNAGGLAASGASRLVNKAAGMIPYRTASGFGRSAAQAAGSNVAKAWDYLQASQKWRLGRAMGGLLGEGLTETLEQLTEYEIRKPWDKSLQDQSLEAQLVDSAVAGAVGGFFFGALSPRAQSPSSYYGDPRERALRRRMWGSLIAGEKIDRLTEGIGEAATLQAQRNRQQQLLELEAAQQAEFEDVMGGMAGDALAFETAADAEEERRRKNPPILRRRGKQGLLFGDTRDPIYIQEEEAEAERLQGIAEDLGKRIENDEIGHGFAASYLLESANTALDILDQETSPDLVNLVRKSREKGTQLKLTGVAAVDSFMKTLDEVYSESLMRPRLEMVGLERRGKGFQLAFKEQDGISKDAIRDELRKRGLNPDDYLVRKIAGNTVKGPGEVQQTLFDEEGDPKEFQVGLRYSVTPKPGIVPPDNLPGMITPGTGAQTVMGDPVSVRSDGEIYQEAMIRERRKLKDRHARALERLSQVAPHPLVNSELDRVAADIQTETATLQDIDWRELEDIDATSPGQARLNSKQPVFDELIQDRERRMMVPMRTFMSDMMGVEGEALDDLLSRAIPHFFFDYPFANSAHKDLAEKQLARRQVSRSTIRDFVMDPTLSGETLTMEMNSKLIGGVDEFFEGLLNSIGQHPDYRHLRAPAERALDRAASFLFDEEHEIGQRKGRIVDHLLTGLMESYGEKIGPDKVARVGPVYLGRGPYDGKFSRNYRIPLDAVPEKYRQPFAALLGKAFGQEAQASTAFISYGHIEGDPGNTFTVLDASGRDEFDPVYDQFIQRVNEAGMGLVNFEEIEISPPNGKKKRARLIHLAGFSDDGLVGISYPALAQILGSTLGGRRRSAREVVAAAAKGLAQARVAARQEYLAAMEAAGDDSAKKAEAKNAYSRKLTDIKEAETNPQLAAKLGAAQLEDLFAGDLFEGQKDIMVIPTRVKGGMYIQQELVGHDGDSDVRTFLDYVNTSAPRVERIAGAVPPVPGTGLGAVARLAKDPDSATKARHELAIRAAQWMADVDDGYNSFNPPTSRGWVIGALPPEVRAVFGMESPAWDDTLLSDHPLFESVMGWKPRGLKSLAEMKATDEVAKEIAVAISELPSLSPEVQAVVDTGVPLLVEPGLGVRNEPYQEASSAPISLQARTLERTLREGETGQIVWGLLDLYQQVKQGLEIYRATGDEGSNNGYLSQGIDYAGVFKIRLGHRPPGYTRIESRGTMWGERRFIPVEEGGLGLSEDDYQQTVGELFTQDLDQIRELLQVFGADPTLVQEIDSAIESYFSKKENHPPRHSQGIDFDLWKSLRPIYTSTPTRFTNEVTNAWAEANLRRLLIAENASKEVQGRAGVYEEAAARGFGFKNLDELVAIARIFHADLFAGPVREEDLRAPAVQRHAPSNDWLIGNFKAFDTEVRGGVVYFTPETHPGSYLQYGGGDWNPNTRTWSHPNMVEYYISAAPEEVIVFNDGEDRWAMGGNRWGTRGRMGDVDWRDSLLAKGYKAAVGVRENGAIFEVVVLDHSVMTRAAKAAVDLTIQVRKGDRARERSIEDPTQITEDVDWEGDWPTDPVGGDLTLRGPAATASVPGPHRRASAGVGPAHIVGPVTDHLQEALNLLVGVANNRSLESALVLPKLIKAARQVDPSWQPPLDVIHHIALATSMHTAPRGAINALLGDKFNGIDPQNLVVAQEAVRVYGKVSQPQPYMVERKWDVGNPLLNKSTRAVSTRAATEAEMESVYERHKGKALNSERDYEIAMMDLSNNSYIPAAPRWTLDTLKKGPKALKSFIDKASDDQFIALSRGLANILRARERYNKGELSERSTIYRMVWSTISSSIGSYVHEAAWLRMAMGEYRIKAGGIDAVMNLDEVIDFMLNPGESKVKKRRVWAAWVDQAMPAYDETSPLPFNGATRNVGQVGSKRRPNSKEVVETGITLFETLLSTVPYGKHEGQTVLQAAHSMLSDPDVTGREFRTFMVMHAQGGGMQNKLLSFVALTAGKADVMVPDRIMTSLLFGRDEYEQVFAKLFSGPAGEVVTRWFEDGFFPQAHEQLLRTMRDRNYPPEAIKAVEDAGLGAVHWLLWQVAGEQVTSHPTLDHIVMKEGGVADPYRGAYVLQGDTRRKQGGTYYFPRLGDRDHVQVVPLRDGTYAVVPFNKFHAGLDLIGEGVKANDGSGTYWKDRPGVQEEWEAYFRENADRIIGVEEFVELRDEGRRPGAGLVGIIRAALYGSDESGSTTRLDEAGTWSQGVSAVGEGDAGTEVRQAVNILIGKKNVGKVLNLSKAGSKGNRFVADRNRANWKVERRWVILNPEKAEKVRTIANIEAIDAGMSPSEWVKNNPLVIAGEETQLRINPSTGRVEFLAEVKIPELVSFESFKNAMKDVGMTEDQAHSATTFLRGIAHVAGKSEAQFFSKILSAIRILPAGTRAQQLGTNAWGMVDAHSLNGADDVDLSAAAILAGESTMVMDLMAGADFSVVMHELGHVLRSAMPEKMQRSFYRSMGIHDEDIDHYIRDPLFVPIEIEELWAHMVEQYFYGGEETLKRSRVLGSDPEAVRAVRAAGKFYKSITSSILDIDAYRYGHRPITKEVFAALELVMAAGTDAHNQVIGRQMTDLYRKAKIRYEMYADSNPTQGREGVVLEHHDRMATFLNTIQDYQSVVSTISSKGNAAEAITSGLYQAAMASLHAILMNRMYSGETLTATERTGFRSLQAGMDKLKNLIPAATIAQLGEGAAPAMRWAKSGVGIPLDWTPKIKGVFQSHDGVVASIADSDVLLTTRYDEAIVHNVENRKDIQAKLEAARKAGEEGKYEISYLIKKPAKEGAIAQARKKLEEGVDPNAAPLDKVSTITHNANRTMWGWLKDSASSFYRMWIDSQASLEALAAKHGWNKLHNLMLQARSAAESAVYVINSGTKLWDDSINGFRRTGDGLVHILGGRDQDFVDDVEAMAVAKREIGIYEEVAGVQEDLGIRLLEWEDRSRELKESLEAARQAEDHRRYATISMQLKAHRSAQPKGPQLSQFYEAYSRDKAGFELRYEQAKRTLAQLSATSPPERYAELEKAVHDLTGWMKRAVLDRHLEIGTITKDEYDLITLRHNQRGGTYIPFHRIWAHVTSNDLRQITGDLGEGIVSPLAAMVVKAQRTSQWADTQLVLNEFYQIAKEDQKLPLEERAMPEVRIYERGTVVPAPVLQKYKKVTAFENGEAFHLYLPKDLYDAVGRGEFAPLQWKILKASRAMTRLKRAGATLAIGFITRNPLRDQLMAATNSRWGYTPFKNWGTMMAMALGKPSTDPQIIEWMDEYYRNNAAIAGLVETGMEHAHLTLQDVMAVHRDPDNRVHPGTLGAKLRALRARKGAPLATAVGGLTVLEHWASKLESATRLAMYVEARRSGADPMQATEEAREGTIDFMRSGTMGRKINAHFAFFNAGMQDVGKFWRMMNSSKTTGKEKAGLGGQMGYLVRAGIFLGIPSIINLVLNWDDEDYDKLPAWDRGLFYHLKIGDGKDMWYLRYPRPLGILSIALGYGLETMVRGLSGKNPDWKNDWVHSFVEGTPLQYANIFKPKATSMNWIPDAAKPMAELWTNYDTFRDRPIIPRSEEVFPKDLQGDDYFGPVEATLSKASGLWTGHPLASRYQVNHLISGYTATLGRQAIDHTNDLVDFFSQHVLRKPGSQSGRIPERMSAFERPLNFLGLRSRAPIGPGSQPLTDFYRTLERGRTGSQAINDMRKSGQVEAAFKYLKRYPEAQFYSEASRLSAEFSEYRKMRKQIARSGLPPEAQYELGLQIDMIMGQKAALFMETVRELSPEIRNFAGQMQ